MPKSLRHVRAYACEGNSSRLHLSLHNKSGAHRDSNQSINPVACGVMRHFCGAASKYITDIYLEWTSGRTIQYEVQYEVRDGIVKDR
jgi:hypothetical protein